MAYRCRCWQCCDDPPPTLTAEYKLECEARLVASWPRATRLDYFDRIERRRGLDGVIVLKHAIARLPTPPGEG